jgi:hypothetical protein
MEQQIAQIISDEVDRRVNDRITKVLEHISKTYDISLQRLMKDTSQMPENGARITQCLGLTAKGKRCPRSGSTGESGYCKSHLKQAPVVRTFECRPTAAPAAIAHTHSLPPLFLVGCPACEQSKNNRLNI